MHKDDTTHISTHHFFLRQQCCPNVVSVVYSVVSFSMFLLLFALMSVGLCCDDGRVTICTNAWIHPALYERIRLLVVQCCGGYVG